MGRECGEEGLVRVWGGSEGRRDRVGGSEGGRKT